MSGAGELPPGKRALLSAILAELDTPEADLGRVLAKHRTAQQPRVVQQMLRRACLPRRFDEALYRDLLCQELDDAPPAFADFVQLAEVQRLPRDAGYCLRDEPRTTLRAAWRRDDPPAWRQWHQRIADYLKQQRPDDATGQLYHLVLAHAPAALACFTSRFDAADARFDLAKCFGLLAVLDEVQEDLGSELAAARLARQQRYGGRALFASDYYRANVYQERPGARTAMAAVIDVSAPAPMPGGTAPMAAAASVAVEPPKWILHVFATGGMGKTAFVRWLIARQLVPAGVACARVDFDLVNTANVASQPWLLLIPFGEQLNAQLPRQYFTELLKELRAWEPLLEPPKSATPSAPALPDRATTDRFVRQFASSLLEAGGRTLLVLDTLESLSRADQIMPVYQLLAGLHTHAPHLRCMLAGRYNIAVKVAAAGTPEVARFVAEFSANAEIQEIARFSDDEARRYLQGRGVNDVNGEEIVESIVRKVRQPSDEGQAAGCNPFTLALVTELVLGLDAGSITRKDIEALPSARFVYLVDRVIRRIPDQPLRWVVRYGALPRRLTPAYIGAVLLDPLQRALRGELPEDQLGTRPSATGLIPEPDVWKIDLAARPTVDALWTALCAYESPRGWISRAPGAAEAIQFHGDVVDPMRDLLSHQGIFSRLQRESIGYFEQLARDEPARWADWTCEAIFHTFQLEGDAGAAYWQRQLAAPQAEANPAVRRQIAREVLRHEYAEDEQTPRRRGDGEQLISTATLARAHVETARAILAVTGYVSTADPDGRDLEQHVRLARQLGGSGVEAMMEAAVLASVEASRLTSAGQQEEAAQVLTTALAATTDPGLRFSIEYQFADTLALLRRAEASTHFREAIRLHRGPGRTGVRLVDLQIKLATWYQREGHDLSARDVLRAAYDEARDDPGACEELELALAWSAIRTGDYDRVRSMFGAPLKAWIAMIERRGPVPQQLASWLSLATENPVNAKTFADQALHGAITTLDQAGALDLLGRVHVELMQFSEASGYWERAIPVFTRTAVPLVIENCFLDQIAMHTRVTGNFKEAASLIAQAERLPGAHDADICRRLDCERLFVQVHLDRAGDARDTLARLTAPRTPEWRALFSARIMAAGFALDLLPSNDVTLMAFWELLDAIRPVVARLDIADVLRLRMSPLTESSYWRQRFLSLFPLPDSRKDSFVARAVRAAEIHRLVDSPTVARGLFTSALERLITSQSPWAAVRALEGLRRLDVGVQTPSAAALSFSANTSPFVHAVMQLDRLAAMIDAADAGGTIDAAAWSACVAEVESGLATEHTQTRWHARFAELKAVHILRTKGDWGLLQAAVLGAIEAHRALGDALGEQRIQREMPMFKSAPPTAAPAAAAAEAVEIAAAGADDSGRDALPAAEGSPFAYDGTQPLPPPTRGLTVASWPPRAMPPAPAPTPIEPATPPASQAPGPPPAPRSLRGSPSAEQASGWLDVDATDISAIAEMLQVPEAIPALDRLLTQYTGIEASLPEAAVVLPRGARSALPWEWARPSQFLCRTRESGSPVTAEVTRWLQRALNHQGESLAVDGVYGPATVAAMTRFVKAEKLPVGFRPALARLRQRAAPAEDGRSAPVLVVAPREFGHDAGETTFAATGVGPSEVYRMFGGRTGVEILREPSLAEFQDALKHIAPAVVHLVCTLTEISGLTYIGFSRRERATSELIAAPTLHRLLLSNSSTGPFLVLDVTRPSSTWEAASCLLRRNQFATDLFYLEGVPGILATGAAQPSQALRLERCIASSLVPGTSMRELVTAIRSSPADRSDKPFDHLLAFTGAALFTAEPELPCLQT